MRCKMLLMTIAAEHFHREWLHGYNAEPNARTVWFAFVLVQRVPCASTRRRPHMRRRLCRTHCEVAMTDRYIGRSTRAWKRLRLRVLEQSDICWLCGQPGADTVDHIIPLSVAPHLGESPDNVAAAHRSCNSSRGARMPTGARPLPTSRAW